jgi:predicted Zn-dependent peptidase
MKFTQSKSGIPVLILPTDRKMAKVAIFINAGSMLETHTRGLAHFFEHLMFKGTPTRTPLEVIQQVEIMGADSNAYTSKGITSYYMLGLNEHLERCMEILGDMTQNALFRPEDVENEKSIVIQEIHQSNDEIDSVCWDLFEDLCYDASTAVGAPVLGTEKSVSLLTTQDCLDFRSKYYVKNNVCVAVSSALKPKKILEMVDQYFGNMHVGVKQTFPNVTRLAPSRKYLKTPKFSQSCVYMGWPVEDPYMGKSEIQYIISEWMGGGMSSPLFQTVREKLGLAYQVGSTIHYTRDFGDMIFYSKCEGNKHDVVIDAMLSVLHDVLKNPNSLDFERAKNHRLVRLSQMMDNPIRQMETHINRIFMDKDPLDLEKVRKDVLNLKQNQVLEHLETLVSVDPTIAVVCPE